MGHWVLEVVKMSVYVALPLSTFVVFNDPRFYIPILYDWRKETKKFNSNNEIVRNMFSKKRDPLDDGTRE